MLHLIHQANTLAQNHTLRIPVQPDFLRMPHCKLYLQHEGRYLTGKELNFCRQCLPEKEIQQYFVKRHEWAPQTAESIHWQAFKAASNKSLHIKSFLSKLCAKALPTNHKLAQREGITPNCLLCGQHETNCHLWHCCQRHEWRQTFLRKLNDTLSDLGTNQYIQEHIIEQLDEYLHGSTPRTIENPIGWDCMMLGFLPREWALHNAVDPISWGTSLIVFIWTEIHALWKHRNQTVHRSNENHRSIHEELRARTAIKAFYRYKEEVGPYDKDIFHIPWQTRMQTMSPKEILSWIRTMSTAVLTARKQYLARSTLGTRDIRSYFTQPAAS